MHNANFMELETNISFDCEIDNVPIVKQNFATIFVGKKKVQRPTSIERYGQIKITTKNLNKTSINFLEKWIASKKRIDIMIETPVGLYILKRTYIKSLEKSNRAFTVFYNDFKES